MKILVCDTGPLNYLIQIDAVGHLPALFPKLLIPRPVLAELTAPAAPAPVRDWASKPPVWCSVVDLTSRLSGDFPGLSAADLEVLALAHESRAAVLLDDLAARKAARRLAIPLLGTLGFLELAAISGFIHLPNPIERLQRTNIRLSPSLYDDALRRHGF